jgi:hypothetical protein
MKEGGRGRKEGLLGRSAWLEHKWISFCTWSVSVHYTCCVTHEGPLSLPLFSVCMMWVGGLCVITFCRR